MYAFEIIIILFIPRCIDVKFCTKCVYVKENKDYSLEWLKVQICGFPWNADNEILV